MKDFLNNLLLSTLWVPLNKQRFWHFFFSALPFVLIPSSGFFGSYFSPENVPLSLLGFWAVLTRREKGFLSCYLFSSLLSTNKRGEANRVRRTERRDELTDGQTDSDERPQGLWVKRTEMGLNRETDGGTNGRNQGGKDCRNDGPADGRTDGLI